MTNSKRHHICALGLALLGAFLLAPAPAAAQTWVQVGTGGLALAGVKEPHEIAAYDDDPPRTDYGSVGALAVFKGELYAAGHFDTAGGKRAANIARWNGKRWAPLGEGIVDGGVSQLLVHEGALYVAGSWKTAGGKKTQGLVRWDGVAWSAVGTGLDGAVSAMTIHEGALVVVGSFQHAGGVAAKNVARWDGKVWSALGELPNAPYAIGVHAGTLYSGGTFIDAGKPELANFYKWDGRAWQGVASFSGAVTGMVSDGDRLYTWGSYRDVRVVRAPRAAKGKAAKELDTGAIAQWDGKAWSSVGGGLVWPQGRSRAHVAVLAMVDGALHAAGDLGRVGDVDHVGVARWDGKMWAPIGSGLAGEVGALAIYEGALYAGGDFDVASADPLKPSAPHGNVARLLVPAAPPSLNLHPSPLPR